MLKDTELTRTNLKEIYHGRTRTAADEPHGIDIVWQWPDPIMPAAEDDDTLTAAAATPQYDSEGNLKLDNLLTSTAISIKQGNVWEPLDNDASIKDGTPVRVEIAYKVPAGALQNDKNTATYTLPKGVYPKKDLTGNITDSNDEIIGTFTLTKNSPTVTFTFNNNGIEQDAR